VVKAAPGARAGVEDEFQGGTMHGKSSCFAALLLAASACAFSQSITLLAPNNGADWQLGTEQTIAWSVTGYSGGLNILLIKDGVETGFIAKNVGPAAGSYKWTVGKLLNGQAVAGDGYRVRIGSPDWSLKDATNGKFKLSPAVYQMIQAKPLPAAPVRDLQFIPLNQLNVKKLPNPAAVKLDFQILEMNNQFSIEKLRIVGTVENIGPAEFQYSGTATLYRGGDVAAQKSFAKLGSRQSFTVEFFVREGYDFTAQGFSFPVEYKLQISYPPGIQAKPEEIDGDMNNNQAKLAGAVIAQEAYQSYAKSYRQQLTGLINQYRQGNGLAPLALDTCISNAAQAHSEWMKTTLTFSHTGKGGSSHQTRCQQAGCSCKNENIYNGGMSPNDAFSSWKKSTAGHNETMLGPFTRIGIGICSGWITADFD
jgi:hypothetical protein